jgi:hypothetical protein
MTSAEWRRAQQGEVAEAMRLQSLPRDVEEAVYTACSEIPDAHPEDILDCVCGMLPRAVFELHRDLIRTRIRQLV